MYYSSVHSHLKYAITNWGNSAKSHIRKLQVRKNCIVKILCERFGRKTKLLLLHPKLQFLRINELYKLKLAKFMIKVHSNNFLLLVIRILKLQRFLQSTRIPHELHLKIVTPNGLNLPKLNNQSKVLELKFGITFLI